MELILIYISRFSVLIPLAFLIARRNRFKFKSINLIGLLLIISGLTDLTTYLMGAKSLNTAYISNFYTPIEFLLLCLFYQELLPRYKNLISLSLGIFLLFFLVDSLFIENLAVFQSYTLTFEGIVFFMLSLIYLVYYLRRLDSPEAEPIIDEEAGSATLKSTPNDEDIFSSRNYAHFWLNSAVFFYFAMDIYLFSISRFVFTHESADTAMLFWGFHNFCNTVKNLFFAVGIYYAGEKEEGLMA